MIATDFVARQTGDSKRVKNSSDQALPALLREVRACRHCQAHLPCEPRPVLRAASSARLLIIGQAPGTRVHASGIPWNDPSGDRLRQWLGLDSEAFYDESRVAIVPMGLCYPGRGKSGDLPPRPECAPLWHARVLAHLPEIRLTLLIGRYAHLYYLGRPGLGVAEVVRGADWYRDSRLPLVHPSPRNRRWLADNPWFEQDFVPVLRTRVKQLWRRRASGR